MQVTKEMNVMFSTKKITTIVRNIVSRISLAALLVIVGMVGTAAASRPMVTSTDPADDAINVPTPAGGWDSAAVQAGAAKPAVKPVAIKHTASGHSHINASGNAI